MNTNVQMLKDEIKRSGFTQETLANAIGIDKSTFYRKMQRNGSTFTIEQMHKMVDILHISQENAVKIFLQ